MENSRVKEEEGWRFWDPSAGEENQDGVILLVLQYIIQLPNFVCLSIC